MKIVHCPHCGKSDWRYEQEYHLDLFLWGYTCIWCGRWISEGAFDELAKEGLSDKTMTLIKTTLDDMADDVVKHLRDARIAGLFDGEDSQ